MSCQMPIYSWVKRVCNVWVKCLFQEHVATVQYKSRAGLVGWAPGPGWVMFHCTGRQFVVATS